MSRLFKKCQNKPKFPKILQTVILDFLAVKNIFGGYLNFPLKNMTFQGKDDYSKN
jgi:hypothetical protein